MGVVVRGSLIGGAVGATLAFLRDRRRAEPAESALARYAKSTAEGAVAGAAVGWLAARRR